MPQAILLNNSYIGAFIPLSESGEIADVAIHSQRIHNKRAVIRMERIKSGADSINLQYISSEYHKRLAAQ